MGERPESASARLNGVGANPRSSSTTLQTWMRFAARAAYRAPHLRGKAHGSPQKRLVCLLDRLARPLTIHFARFLELREDVLFLALGSPAEPTLGQALELVDPTQEILG